MSIIIPGIVKSATTTTPPGSPNSVDRYIIPASGATGAWASNANYITWYENAAWQFALPYYGVEVGVFDTGIRLFWNGTAWVGITVVDDTSTAATYYPLFATAAGGLGHKTSSSKLTYNPSTGVFSASGFTLLSSTYGIVIPTGAPTTTTNALYQVGGNLFFNGNQLGFGVGAIYNTTIGNASSTSFTITHNLGNTNYSVTLWETTGQLRQITSGVVISNPTTTQVTLTFTTAPATNGINVIVTSGGNANPMTTLGDTLYGGASGLVTRLAGPTVNGTYLKTEIVTASISVAPSWVLATGTGAPVLATSPTFTSGKVTFAACVTGYASFNIPTGTAPTTLVAGDMWITSNKLWYYNGTISQALDPFTTIGDTDYGGTNGIQTRLAGPTTNGTWVLTEVVTASAAVAPTWTQVSASTPVADTAAGTAGTTGLAFGNHAHPQSTLYCANLTTTVGDIIYCSATASPGTLSRLGGSAGVLQSTGAAAPTWTQSPSLVLPTCSTGIILTPSVGGTTSGETWVDSTRYLLTSYSNGLKGYNPILIYSQYGNVSVSSASITTLTGGTAIGTLTLPANYLVAGAKFIIKAGGYYSTTSGTVTIIFTLTMLGTTISTSGALALTASMTNMGWSVEYEINAASATSVWTQGWARFGISTTALAGVYSIVTSSAVTVPQTATAFNLQVTQSSASSTTVCTYLTIERTA